MVSLGLFSVVPPTEPCALGSTQPLKMSTREFSWGKGGRCVWLTTYHPCSAETSSKSETFIYPEPHGPPRPVAARLYFLLYTNILNNSKTCDACELKWIPGFKGLKATQCYVLRTSCFELKIEALIRTTLSSLSWAWVPSTLDVSTKYELTEVNNVGTS